MPPAAPQPILAWFRRDLRLTDNPGGRGPPGPGRLLRELGWREFSHHHLFHNPEMGARRRALAAGRTHARGQPQADPSGR